MISLIVYGRNDNHGYNLHKRAALSLNCLAEILDDPTDEIIFVDYNTPNDFPTFPEAIQDTLTAKTKALLRVLRARPSIHDRFRTRTTLAVAEPVARNIALRRSNPANAWVLSTNTDMLLLPRTTPSLSRAVGDLPAGLYHTPRFEIPETFWESFDRLKPDAVLGDLGRLARMAHLNEIVHASPTIVFDGPGDFQLARRDDLFAIDGFDERMLIGWHVDANLAARFALRGQPATDVNARVFSYHCDHTRQSTAAHTRERVENDPVRFVDRVSEADIPEQRDSWGCPHDAIEEIRLRGPSAGPYISMLESVLPRPECETTESVYRGETFGTFIYRPSHVLPFLMDMLVTQPPGTRLGWCGGRRDMFDLAVAAWSKLGFRQPILVETGNAARLGLTPNASLTSVSREDWIERAEILVFEFGLPSHSGQEVSWRDAPRVKRDDAAALFSVRALFLAAAEAERARRDASRPPRLFIGVNCIHNASEELFVGQVAANATPFSTHVRHGFVAAETPGLCTPSSTRAETRPLTKVADSHDWDCPGWASHAALFKRDRTGGLDRDLATWEQAHLSYVLARCGLRDSNANILVAATMPDRLVGALSLHANVTHLQLGPDGPGREVEPDWCADRSFYDPDSLKVGLIEEDFEGLAAATFDAVVFPHHSLFLNGTASAVTRLSAVDRLIKPGGLLVFKAEISSGPQPEYGLHAGQIGHDGLAAWLQATTGYVVEGGGLDTRVGEATLDSVWKHADPSPLGGAFLRMEPDGAVATSIWVLRKRRQTKRHGWAALHSRLSPFPALPQFRIGPAGLTRPSGGVEIVKGKVGHVVFGPYVALPGGTYTASVDLEISHVAPAGKLTIDVVDGDTRLSEMVLKASRGQQVVSLTCEISSAGATQLEIRCHSNGGVGGIITAIGLTPSTKRRSAG